MRNKKLSILALLVASVLAGPSAAYADNGAEKTSEQAKKQVLIQARPEATMERLGTLDSRIEVLKKQLEIKKLESEIKEAGKEDEQDKPADFRDQLSRFMPPPQKRAMDAGQLPAFAQENADEGLPGPEEEAREQGASKDEFEKFISQARVVSVGGFDKDLRAEIKLPGGGSQSVEEGRDYGSLGTVKNISHNSLMIEKSGDKFFVPFSEKFGAFESSNSQQRSGYMDSSGLDPNDPAFIDEDPEYMD